MGSVLGAPFEKAAESGDKGVLTVWPIHLAVPHLSDSLSHSPSATATPPSTQLKQFAATGEGEQGLMQTAYSLFDFFTSYREPSVPPEGDGGQVDDQDPDYDNEVGLADNDADMNETGGEGLNLGEIGMGTGGDIEMEPTPKEGSDIDDLFSSPSPTSTPNVNVSSQPQSNKSPPPQQAQGQNDNTQGGEEDFMNSLVSVRDPSPPARSQVMGIGDRGREKEAEVEITEDDFAFFDSPAAEEGDGIGMDVDMSMDSGINQSLSDDAVDHGGEISAEPLIEQEKGLLAEEMLKAASPKAMEQAGQDDLTLVPLVGNGMEMDGVLQGPLPLHSVETATKELQRPQLPIPLQPSSSPTILETSPKAPPNNLYPNPPI